MRFRFSTSLLLTATLTVAFGPSVHAQTTPPLGRTAGFFVVDFNSGTTPEYTFQYNYLTGQSTSVTNMIQALAAALNPTFTEAHQDFGGSLGYFYKTFSVTTNGTTQSATDTNYDPTWTLYTSTNGTAASWTAASNGASSTFVTAGTPYAAFSFGPSPFGTGTPIRPLTAPSVLATVTQNATPEPDAAPLLILGLAFGGAIIARRRRRA